MSKQSQNLTAIALGSAMTFAGISHLTFKREEFQAQVPNWFPMNKDAVVLGSGVAEIALGAGLLAWKKRRREVGVALAAFYAAIYPGNIGQYAERHDGFGLDTDGKRLARLFFQPALIAGALHAAGLPEKK
ncbi:DoxX family protein [Corynebacterium hadale]